MRFRTTIQQTGKNTTGIPVPDDVVAALGSGRRPAVTVTVNGYSYPSTVASMGGVSMVSLSAEHRAGAGDQWERHLDRARAYLARHTTLPAAPDLCHGTSDAAITRALPFQPGRRGRMRLGTEAEFAGLPDSRAPRSRLSERRAEAEGGLVERLDDDGRQRQLIPSLPTASRSSRASRPATPLVCHRRRPRRLT